VEKTVRGKNGDGTLRPRAGKTVTEHSVPFFRAWKNQQKTIANNGLNRLFYTAIKRQIKYKRFIGKNGSNGFR